jgi:hypothetical protein
VPHNPLAHPLFWPVAWRLALTLLAGLGGVVLAERHRLRQLETSTLFLRVRTWAWIAPVFVLAVFTGGFLVFLLAAAIALQGVAEYWSAPTWGWWPAGPSWGCWWRPWPAATSCSCPWGCSC